PYTTLFRSSIDRRDVVSRVVEMDEAPSFFYRGADVCCGAPRLASLRLQDGARARHDATTIFRMSTQVPLHQIGGFLLPAEIQQSPRDLVVPERLIGFRRNLSELT